MHTRSYITVRSLRSEIEKSPIVFQVNYKMKYTLILYTDKELH